MDYKSNIWKLYIFKFLDMFTLYLPFIIYYFQNLGFSLAKIALLNSVMAITLFIFEIPSGYIADKFGRKNSLIISTIFQVLSIIILFSATSYYLLILSHILLGLCISFLSGADSALLYDTLLTLKKEKLYKKIEGKGIFFGEISVILSALIGSLIIKFGIKYNILITLIGHVILLGITFSLKEPKIHKKIKQITLFKEIKELFSIIKKSVNNKKLLGFFFYSLLILGFSNTIFLFYQPYFRATNLPLHYYGIIFALFSIFTAISSLKAHKIEKKLGVFNSLLLMPLFLVIALIGSSLTFVWFGFIFFFFREIVRGFIFPVLNDYVNKISKSSERATVLSIQSMFSRLGYVIVSLLFGFFTDAFGIRIVLLFNGIVLFLFIGLIYYFLKNSKKI